jgi:hypothetical protein
MREGTELNIEGLGLRLSFEGVHHRRLNIAERELILTMYHD